MFRTSRWLHYLILTLLWASLCLTNLGGPSLWEIDEGLNGQAAREMYESGNWIVPTFNSDLRDAKPVLLYWLQMASYRWLGVSETSARLPSALAALLTILTVYELGRRLFRPTVGLLAGVILATSISPCIAAHFANPDSLLLLWTVLAMASFWHDYTHPTGWRFLLGGVFTGLAVLTKGPVGLVLPLGSIGLFLLWQRRLGWLFVPGQVKGVLAFLLTAAPWYVWVSVETKGQWLVRFLMTQNVNRITGPMEGHGGRFYTYLLFLLVGLAPWSIFLGITVAHTLRRRLETDKETGRQGDKETKEPSLSPCLLVSRSPCPGEPWPWPHLSVEVRFLVCWFVVVFLLFSLAATKLPNYILPLYPAVALLMARALDDWRLGLSRVRNGEISISLVILGLIGVAVAVGLALVGGVGEAPFLHGRFMPGVAWAAWLGLVPVSGAVLGLVLLRRTTTDEQARRTRTLLVVAATAGLFLMLAAGWVAPSFNEYRAPRTLVGLLPADQTSREVRIATCGYFQPSLVFYCKRKVEQFSPDRLDQVREFLRSPLPSYLLLPAPKWEELEGELGRFARPLGRHRDFYCKYEIVLVAN